MYSAQLIAGIIMSQFGVDILQCENRNRAVSDTARARWNWVDLRLCETFEREKDFKCPFSFPDLPNASFVGSLNHATLPILREEECCLYPQHESTFRAFPSLCVSLCLLARLYTAIHRPLAPTHLHVSQAPSPSSFRTHLCRKTCAARPFDPDTEHTRVPQWYTSACLSRVCSLFVRSACL